MAIPFNESTHQVPASIDNLKGKAYGVLPRLVACGEALPNPQSVEEVNNLTALIENELPCQEAKHRIAHNYAMMLFFAFKV